MCVCERETEVCTSWNQSICTSLMERYVSHREAHASSGLSSHIAPRSCPCMCFWALYCKVRTLRLDFAWEAVIAVDRSGGFGCQLEAPWAVPTSLLGRC